MEAAAPLRAKVQVAPSNQRLPNVPTSAVIRVAVKTASVSASLVTVGQTAASPTVQGTATTKGGVSTDSVCVILGSLVPTAPR